jgi:phosphoglycerate dehydrogenase-like enzyme
MNAPFRVGITRDFLKADGTLGFGDIGLDVFQGVADLEWEFLAENTRELAPGQVRGYDALLVLAPRVTADTLRGADRLAVVARFGVGYDSVDVPACTEADVALTITPDGVRRPVAVSALTLLLACAHKLLIKDRLTRAGRWAEKLVHMGTGLTGRTLGVIGLGNTGREVFRLAAPLDMHHLGHDPFVQEVPGVERVGLEELLARADFVCICCNLTKETHHLLDADRLVLMKPTAYLINVARGPIVDQQALTIALREGRFAGAGLDVFEQEPIDPDDPLLKLDNVIVAPHALCWTDELFRGNGRSACAGIVEAARGREPPNVVNREVLARPGFRAKLQRRKEVGHAS